MSDFSMKISRALAIGIISTSLAACTTTGGYFSPVASMDAAQLDSIAADAVAGDMVAKLAENVGPGTGTIALKSDDSAFAASLDKQLRGWGYAVDPAATGAGAGTGPAATRRASNSSARADAFDRSLTRYETSAWVRPNAFAAAV